MAVSKNSCMLLYDNQNNNLTACVYIYIKFNITCLKDYSNVSFYFIKEYR